ncbi:hypothetical protein I3842_07G098500 [Carya illinoinensis]|uniref:Uncharacterized protein n=1 Tax=Carya illinoinensis TaxID=32201 RepID=A0A922EL92_CARIL|nr:hypothetical protein I3842_07G098500 [Carya illinoinensis]
MCFQNKRRADLTANIHCHQSTTTSPTSIRCSPWPIDPYFSPRVHRPLRKHNSTATGPSPTIVHHQLNSSGLGVAQSCITLNEELKQAGKVFEKGKEKLTVLS